MARQDQTRELRRCRSSSQQSTSNGRIILFSLIFHWQATRYSRKMASIRYRLSISVWVYCACWNGVSLSACERKTALCMPVNTSFHYYYSSFNNYLFDFYKLNQNLDLSSLLKISENYRTWIHDFFFSSWCCRRVRCRPSPVADRPPSSPHQKEIP